ncbi:MAG TPA: hypothetical protein VNS52_03065, partial [Gemmatimonadaceae bacterium]|nr:hypothetical protein [Gemmatimonadaceae bacterium]
MSLAPSTSPVRFAARRGAASTAAAAAAAVLSLAACGGSAATHPAPPTAPVAPRAARTSALPPVPHVSGPLDLKVVYPSPNALVQARDSNFIFGSVGNGDATLTINGARVPVQPNGAFLAWLPVPASPQYDLVAAVGADTARLTHPVRLLPPRLDFGDTTRLLVDSASLVPHAPLALPDAERVRVSVRASAAPRLVLPPDSVTTTVASASAVHPAADRATPPKTARAKAARTSVARRKHTKAGAPHPAAPAPAPAPVAAPLPLVAARADRYAWSLDLPARRLRRGATLLVARGADTVRLAIPAVAPVDTGGVTRWALAGAAGGAPPADSAARGTIIARPTPGGTYKWFLLPGTPLEITGHSGDFTRVRFDADLDVWVGDGDLTEQPAGTPAPVRRTAGNVRLMPSAEYVDIVVPTGTRPAYDVEEGPDGLVLTLYNTVANSDVMQYVGNDSLVRAVTWTQPTSDRARYAIRLARAPYGYETLWNGSALVLR